MANEKLKEDGSKRPTSSKYLQAGVFTTIAAILYCFWAIPYRAALSYREQLQLFQTTGEYFKGLIERSAGFATYVGEFLTQFFNNYWIGAAVMAFVMSLFFMSCRSLCRRFSPSASETTILLYALLPLISLLLFMGNPDVTLGFVIAILSVVSSASFVIGISGRGVILKYVLMIIVTSLLYWLAGPVVVVFTLLLIIWNFAVGKESIIGKASYAVVSLVWLILNVFVWSSFITYPLSYQLTGIGYVMIPDRLYAGQVVVELLCVLAPVLALFAGRIPGKVLIPTLTGIEIAAVVILYPRSYDASTYRLIDYDYMVRANDWKGILDYSDDHDPDLPLSVSATNLAAGMTGQLDSRAFDYFQRGPEGLIPTFAKETLSSWTTGEIFFHLGMVNSAQRFYFEGMEAIPNYNKSSRAVKRLAETAIIRGDYALAEKYLTILKNTLFYRKWAQKNLDLIRNPQEVANHPLYGTLRQRMVNEDYLFSEGELDKTLGQLYIKDSGNSLAMQYLILYPLLQRDLNKFAQYMGVVAESQPKYNPPLAQQALAFMSMKNGQPIPQNAVSPAVEQTLRGFAQAWVSKDPSRIEPYRRTLYYYLLSEE